MIVIGDQVVVDPNVVPVLLKIIMQPGIDGDEVFSIGEICPIFGNDGWGSQRFVFIVIAFDGDSILDQRKTQRRADGYEVRAGDTVYVRHGSSVQKKKVFTVLSDYKLTYDYPDQQGYVGARHTWIYKHKPNDCYEIEE